MILFDWPDGRKLTFDEISLETGISTGALRSRYHRNGRDIMGALNPPKKAAVKHLYDGEYLTISEIAALVGVAPTALYSRVNKAGLSVEEAVERAQKGKISRAHKIERITSIYHAGREICRQIYGNVAAGEFRIHPTNRAEECMFESELYRCYVRKLDMKTARLVVQYKPTGAVSMVYKYLVDKTGVTMTERMSV